MRLEEMQSVEALTAEIESDWYARAESEDRRAEREFEVETVAAGSIHPCCPYTKVDAPINPPR